MLNFEVGWGKTALSCAVGKWMQFFIADTVLRANREWSEGGRQRRTVMDDGDLCSYTKGWRVFCFHG